MGRTKLRDEMDNELLNQVSAVSDARDEGGAGNFNPAKWEARANGADKERGHAEGDQRELPDAHRDGDGVGLGDVKRGNDKGEARQPEPGRVIEQTLPPLRPECFDRGQGDAEQKWIKPSPGGAVNPGLIAGERDAAIADILERENPTEGESGENDGARNNERRAAPPNNQEQDEGQQQIELVFDGQRPCVGEGGPATQPNVLGGEKKFPERKHFRILAPRWEQDIDGENDEVGWQDAQGAPGKEAAEPDPLPARDRGEELSADQVTAENEKKIDADPAEAVDPAGKREAHDAGVVDDDDDDRESAEKIETGLALAIGKARIQVTGRRRGYGVAGGDRWSEVGGQSDGK